MTDKAEVKEKYPEDENGTNKLQKDVFRREYDEVQNQIKNLLNNMNERFDQLDKKLD